MSYTNTADFFKKDTFSVHSCNEDYLSIPERPGSYKYLFHEIPGRRSFLWSLREDTQKKISGRTTKGVGRVNPLDHYAKNHFLAQKLGRKRKNSQNPFQAIIRLKNKWHGPHSAISVGRVKP